jgi:hypothetical protein
MSLMEKIKSFFSGGSSGTESHAGHDHSGDDHSHEPVAPIPSADPLGTPPAEPEPEDKPGY